MKDFLERWGVFEVTVMSLVVSLFWGFFWGIVAKQGNFYYLTAIFFVLTALAGFAYIWKTRDEE